MKRIPIYQPDISGNELAYVKECIESTWISSKGRYVDEFEKKFCDFVGGKHAVTCSNGTVAIHLALLALGVTEGDEVIVPSFTYVASVNPIKYCNATPIFVDSARDTWQMCPSDIQGKIGSKTKAIIVPHLYGHPCDMDAIMKIAKDNDLFVIEDCAEAIGTKYKGKHVGTFGDFATFSFFGNKTITTGEGGMLIANSDHMCKKARHYRGQGLSSLNPDGDFDNVREYWHDVVGYNYRLTNISCAIGCAQLEKVDHFLAEKRRVAELYFERLKPHDSISMLWEKENCASSFWMISILVESNSIREKVRAILAKNCIETRPLFPQVHSMPMYAQNGQYEVAAHLSSCGMNLPSYPGLSTDDINRICDLIIASIE